MGRKRYKVVLRYYGRANFLERVEGQLREVVVEVDNPELVRVVPFPAPEEGCDDFIAIYEFVPVEVEE